MKLFVSPLVVFAAAVVVACGSPTPEPAAPSAPTTPTAPAASPTVGTPPAPARPVSSGGKAAPAPGSCEAAGGTCTSVAARVVCKSQPAVPCAANEFCCVP